MFRAISACILRTIRAGILHNAIVCLAGLICYYAIGPVVYMMGKLSGCQATDHCSILIGNIFLIEFCKQITVIIFAYRFQISAGIQNAMLVIECWIQEKNVGILSIQINSCKNVLCITLYNPFQLIQVIGYKGSAAVIHHFALASNTAKPDGFAVCKSQRMPIEPCIARAVAEKPLTITIQ